MLMNAISGGANWLIVHTFSDRIEPPFGCPFDSQDRPMIASRELGPDTTSRKRAFAPFALFYHSSSRCLLRVLHTRKGLWIFPELKPSWGRSRPSRCTRVRSFVLAV